MDLILECSKEILRTISAAARKRAEPRHIGILTGFCGADRVGIEGWKGAEKPLRRGAQSVIPEADEDSLRRVIRSNPESQAAGFFVCVRGGGAPTLTDGEAETFACVFPELQRVALAITDGPDGCRARFYARS